MNCYDDDQASNGTKQADKWDDPTTSASKNDDSYHFTRSSSVLSQITGRRSHTPTPSLTRSASRSSNIMDNSFKRSMSTKRALSTPRPSEFSKCKLTSQHSNVNNLSRSTSRRSTTPIIFSQSTSTIRRKPHPTERRLECSLEELCFGAIKKVMVTRDVISDVGCVFILPYINICYQNSKYDFRLVFLVFNLSLTRAELIVGFLEA